MKSLIKSLLVVVLIAFSAATFAQMIDINTATAEQLDKGLKGIGPKKAADIVKGSIWIPVSSVCYATSNVKRGPSRLYPGCECDARTERSPSTAAVSPARGRDAVATRNGVGTKSPPWC